MEETGIKPDRPVVVPCASRGVFERDLSLRIAFDRPEYRVMLVADKFQTGFDQPKLVAMYVDKKIGNDVVKAAIGDLGINPEKANPAVS